MPHLYNFPHYQSLEINQAAITKKERCETALSNRLLSVSKIVAYALEVFR